MVDSVSPSPKPELTEEEKARKTELRRKIGYNAKFFNRYVTDSSTLEHARYVVLLKTPSCDKVVFRGKVRRKDLMSVGIYGDNDTFEIIHFRFCRLHLSATASNDYARLLTDRWNIDKETKFLMEDTFYMDESFYVYIYTIRSVIKFYLHKLSRKIMYNTVIRKYISKKFKKSICNRTRVFNTLKERGTFSFVDDGFWLRQQTSTARHRRAEQDILFGMLYLQANDERIAYKLRKKLAKKKLEEQNAYNVSAVTNTDSEDNLKLLEETKEEGKHEQERPIEEP